MGGASDALHARHQRDQPPDQGASVRRPARDGHAHGVPPQSAITLGELLFGLAKRPEATRLRFAVRELLRRVDVSPWDSTAAERYGAVRAAMARHGKVLAPLDLLIAAHALSLGAVLVTNDKAFGLVDALPVEDWSADQAP